MTHPTAAATALAAASLLAACGGPSSPEQRMLTDRPVDRPDLLPLAMPRGMPAAPLALRRIPSPDQFFAFLQAALADHFPGDPPTLNLDGPPDILGIAGAPRLAYRAYTNGNIVGIMGGQVLLISPTLTGGALVRVGALADFADLVFPRFAPATREQAARFLLHAQVGLVDEDIDRVMALGYEQWLQTQFALPLGETAWDWLDARGYGVVDRHEYYDGGAPYFDLAAFRQLMIAPDTLRKRVQLALTEYFVISLRSPVGSWPHFCYATFWDGLAERAFGNFRDLLEFVTLNGAMGAYLNTAGNLKEDPATGRVPDENYAREVMQLFTIGLSELNPDGTLRRDAQGRPIETYTAADVTQLARVFTGYEIDDAGPRAATVIGNRTVPTHSYSRRPMRFTPERHSTLEARFLGVTVPAGASGAQALRIALDRLVAHPNVGPFFGRQLIQRLVTSDPSPAYVGRVAAAFADNGQGVRGDMQAVNAAVLLDQEARGEASLSSPRHGKLREPALRIVQWAYTFRLRSRMGSWKFGLPFGDPYFDFGQRLFWAPSVFNFFRPGFVPPGTELATRGATAPELQIVNEASVAQYANALTLLVHHGPWIFAPERPDNDQSVPSAQSGVGDMAPDYSREIALAHDPAALLERLNLVLCAGQMSAATRARLAAALQEMPVTTASDAPQRQGRVAQAVLMMMLCPAYLVQK